MWSIPWHSIWVCSTNPPKQLQLSTHIPHFFLPRVAPSTRSSEKLCHIAQPIFSSRRRNQPHVIQLLIACHWKMFWQFGAPSAPQRWSILGRAEQKQSSMALSVYGHGHVLNYSLLAWIAPFLNTPPYYTKLSWIRCTDEHPRAAKFDFSALTDCSSYLQLINNHHNLLSCDLNHLKDNGINVFEGLVVPLSHRKHRTAARINHYLCSFYF